MEQSAQESYLVRPALRNEKRKGRKKEKERREEIGQHNTLGTIQDAKQTGKRGTREKKRSGAKKKKKKRRKKQSETRHPLSRSIPQHKPQLEVEKGEARGTVKHHALKKNTQERDSRPSESLT